ncbi:allatostatin-A receptor-like [Patiria miniata]|uniref:G-protein coupled receptors family 1 profile domain-containing protein n=1 Tax=Patiria miniata TaxID=46514 RepID=A0A914ARL1_PATMI|nr:allatostatin-A receptor-like [Patiria miniata]
MDRCSTVDCARTTAITPGDSSDDSSNDWGVDKVAGSDLVLALYGMICTVGVAGNLLVCIVLLRVPSLRSNTSDFLVHLSLVDLVVCVLVIPHKILPLLSQTPPPNPTIWGQLWCRLYVNQYPFWVCAVTSVDNLVLVNLERFVAIVYPHKYKRIFASRNKYLMLGLCWILAMLTKSFIVFLSEEDPVSGCRFGWPSRGVQAAIGVLNFIINLFAPFVLMILVQWKVISTLKKQVKTLTDRNAISEMNPADRRKMWQLKATQILVRTLLAFAVTFAVCWAPNQLMFLVYNLGVPLSLATPIYHVGVILAVCNSCVNPIIYTMTNQQFRKGIKMAFRRGKRSARVGGDTLATSGMATMSTRFDAK